MLASKGPTSSSVDKSTKRQQLQTRYEAWKPRFPNVQDIDVQRLSTWIKEDQSQGGVVRLVLVDARDREEQQVSMIPSRCTLSIRQFEERQAQLKADNAVIVVYCTAGLRSGLYAAKLVNEAGFKECNVYNLGGSILAWTLSDLPVVKPLTSWQGSVEMVETLEVHTCLPDWAQYLSAPYKPVVNMSALGRIRLVLGLVWSSLSSALISWIPGRRKKSD